jgi:hypothetical protein
VGEENNCRIASELAAENSLDLLALSYKDRFQDKDVPGLLNAADMDQKAYNYNTYFILRGQIEYSIPGRIC